MSVVPFDCVLEKQGKASHVRHCPWLGSSRCPLWAEGCESLCPNLDTAGGPQGKSPWLRPSHTQGVDTLTATSSGEEVENDSLFCRFGSVAVILILICPWTAFMPFFLLCPLQSPNWKKNLSSLRSQNRLKSHYGWEPDAKCARAVILFCQILNKSMTCKAGGEREGGFLLFSCKHMFCTWPLQLPSLFGRAAHLGGHLKYLQTTLTYPPGHRFSSKSSKGGVERQLNNTSSVQHWSVVCVLQSYPAILIWSTKSLLFSPFRHGMMVIVTQPSPPACLIRESRNIRFIPFLNKTLFRIIWPQKFRSDRRRQQEDCKPQAKRLFLKEHKTLLWLLQLKFPCSLTLLSIINAAQKVHWEGIHTKNNISALYCNLRMIFYFTFHLLCKRERQFLSHLTSKEGSPFHP